MFVIIGIVIVIGAIVGGYLMEHGNLRVLLQPAELVIIGGAAIGTVLIANPLSILKKIVGGFVGVFGSSKYSKSKYMEMMKMLYELFSRARKEGLMALKTDSDNPEQSPVFSKYPKFLKDHHILYFICDTVRMAAGGGVEPFDMDQMMELDMDVHHHDATQPVNALSTMADALPGLGIVAAVLGVVITMGALGGPPEEIGHKVAAALVGTFLGILLCYGFLGPIASNMAKATEEEHAFPNKMAIEGHTDSKPYPPSATYTNWELSTDRANAARRYMEQNGLSESQITQVRGFADQRPRKPGAPLGPSNRRISLIVQYQEKPPSSEKVQESTEEGAAGEKGGHSAESKSQTNPPAKKE